MQEYEIVRLKPEDYQKCANIWNMDKRPELAKQFYYELLSGNRRIFVYVKNGEYIGEGAIVFEKNDSDYSIPERRIYFSRLVVKENFRNQGIGSILIDYVVEQAKKMNYCEISVGVDKKNELALHLYKKKGFTEVIFDGEDEYGPYYKLLNRLEE